MLSDREILELEELLAQDRVEKLRSVLRDPVGRANPNYEFLWRAESEQEIERGKLVSGYSGVVLEGSSRSGKTWASVDMVINLCEKYDNLTINIYRATYNEFKTTLYDDFKRRLDDFRLPNKFHQAEDVKAFKIGTNKIFFLGCDKVGKAHGGGCDYAFFNEIMHIPEEIFKQVVIRCRKFWWCDYNPSYTDHWVFDTVIPRFDVGFLRTTFRDNPFISNKERLEILATEPYEPGSYEVTEHGLMYRGMPISSKNRPPDHPTNVEQGTADEFYWKVYGLGLRGAMKGVIFENVVWLDAFPDMDYTYANDFGFTADPNVLGKYAEDEENIYIEPMTYQPIETPEELGRLMDAMGVEVDKPIACDSSDKYTGENKGTVEMVRGLREYGYPEAFKISKTKSVMFWILSMKAKKIHIVKNHLYPYIKKEQENYKFKEINGILINQPIDNHNHFWDMARYGHISHNQNEYTLDY